MFERLTIELTKLEGITEQLKEENQLLWIAEMNAVCERVAEIVNHDLICV